MVGDFFLDQLAIGNCGGVVGGGPVLCAGFQPIVELPSLECFKGDGVVAVIVDFQGVEIVEPAIDRQVLAPPVLDPLIANRTAGLHVCHLVRPTAQWHIEVAFTEVTLGPPVLWQYRQLADDQRQLTVPSLFEDKTDTLGAFDLDLFDIGVVAAVHRCTFAHQRIEAELDVFGGYWLTVVEACFGAQVEAYPGVVWGFLDLFCEQTVFGKGFIQTMACQGVVDHADIVGRHALVNEWVEAIEAAKTGLTQGAAFGRIRVYIVEVLEVSRVLGRLVVQGLCVLGAGQGQAGNAKQGNATDVD